MQYTKNYHLPQWVKEDRIMMDDFNQMCKDMEAGLLKTARDAASATSAASAKAAEATKTAQETADAAMEKANNAYCPANKPYVIGSYVGTGEQMEINLGFKPKFLIIAGHMYGYQKVPGLEYTFMCGPSNAGRAQFTDTGFTLPLLSESYPQLTHSGGKYDYIAFR